MRHRSARRAAKTAPKMPQGKQLIIKTTLVCLPPYPAGLAMRHKNL